MALKKGVRHRYVSEQEWIKTVVVAVETPFPIPIYSKTVSRTIRLQQAHDERTNRCKSTRPSPYHETLSARRNKALGCREVPQPHRRQPEVTP